MFLLIFGPRWPMNQLNKNTNIALVETSHQLASWNDDAMAPSTKASTTARTFSRPSRPFLGHLHSHPLKSLPRMKRQRRRCSIAIDVSNSSCRSIYYMPLSIIDRSVSHRSICCARYYLDIDTLFYRIRASCIITNQSQYYSRRIITFVCGLII